MEHKPTVTERIESLAPDTQIEIKSIMAKLSEQCPHFTELQLFTRACLLFVISILIKIPPESLYSAAWEAIQANKKRTGPNP